MVSFGASPVRSANLLTNGSFETGDFTGWTAIGNFQAVSPGGSYTLLGYPTSFLPEDGSYYAALSSISGTVSQTVATTVGQEYQISYYLAADTGTGQEDFGSTFGGVQLQALDPVPYSTIDTNTGYPEYTKYIYDVTASSTSSLLQFTDSSPLYLTYLSLDNVQVQSVPEASSLVSFGVLLVLAGIFFVRARKPKAKSA